MATNTDAEWTARLNTILANLNANYAATFQAVANNLYPALYNRIGLTVVDGPDHAKGVFAKFNKQIADYGDTIQFIKSKVLAGQAYDPDAASPFGGSRNVPIAEYWKNNESIQYEIQITEQDMLKAFSNAGTMGSFVAAQLETLQASREYDQFIEWKKFLSDKTKFEQTHAYEALSAFTGQAIWEKIREVTQSMKFPTTNYNVQGDVAMSSDMTVLITAEAHRLIDSYLAPIYHTDLVGLSGVDIIDVDSFATPSGSDEIVFQVWDDRALGYYPKTPRATSNFNGRALSTTNFLTVQGTYTAAKYRNAYCAIKP